MSGGSDLEFFKQQCALMHEHIRRQDLELARFRLQKANQNYAHHRGVNGSAAIQKALDEQAAAYLVLVEMGLIT